MISMAFIWALIGAVIGLVIGAFILGAVDSGLDCTTITNTDGETACVNIKSYSWTIMGILPITLFLGLFRLFSGSTSQ